MSFRVFSKCSDESRNRSLRCALFPAFIVPGFYCVRLVLFCFAVAAIFSCTTALALEYVRFRHLGKERSEEGRVILEAPDGIAFEARDGQLYTIKQRNLLTRRSDDLPFKPYTKAEILERLKEEFPASEGYNYLDMYDSFIVVYTTSKPFATWYGNLLKKVYEFYVLHWKRLGMKLTEPKFMMVAVVLSSEERFQQYAKQDAAPLFPGQCAYYHKLTNRIAMYDMSGLQAFQERDQRRITAADIERFLVQPGSYHNIMAVCHEAAHQVGYNVGMHPRHTPSVPVWICEGLATLHEVPDQKDKRVGWTLGPHVNTSRLDQLRRYLNTPRLESPIQKMIQNDDLLRTPATALDNYALAWGVTYYLVRKRPKELAAYLTLLQTKTSDSDDDADIRIREFESCFGSDWDAFYRDFAAYMRRL